MSEGFSEIAFDVEPSPETNDHRVLIFIDGRDLIKEYCPDMMGMDPDDILHHRFLAPQELPFEATVARCGCGVVGCGSATVEISTEAETVVWNSWNGGLAHNNPGKLVFQRTHYLDALAKAVDDHSWETPERTAARLLSGKVDIEVLAGHQLKYQWASGRVRDGLFTVSMIGPEGYHQILLHVEWADESPEEIADMAAALLRTDPRGWANVTWYGQATEPPFRGRAWIPDT